MGGIALNANMMNLLLPIFDLNSTLSMHAHYNQLMGTSTYFTMIVNASAALAFCWFLPFGKQQCHDWLQQWKKPMTGLFNLSFGGGVLFFSLTISMLSAIP